MKERSLLTETAYQRQISQAKRTYHLKKSVSALGGRGKQLYERIVIGNADVPVREERGETPAARFLTGRSQGGGKRVARAVGGRSY